MAMKPLDERLAEAERLRGDVTPRTFYRITRIIRESAVDCGEIERPAGRLPPELPPEVPKRGELSIAEIQSFIASYFDISIEDILSHRRAMRIQLPRQIAMYLTRAITSNSSTVIGQRFYRDHSTILHSVRKIERLIKRGESFAAEIAIIMEKLTEQ